MRMDEWEDFMKMAARFAEKMLEDGEELGIVDDEFEAETRELIEKLSPEEE